MKEYGKPGMHSFVRCDNVSTGICFSVVRATFIPGTILHNTIITDVYLIPFTLIARISPDSLEVGRTCVQLSVQIYTRPEGNCEA